MCSSDLATLRRIVPLGSDGRPKNPYLNNTIFDKLIDEYCQDGVLINKLHRLYDFEHAPKNRNTIAHAIVPRGVVPRLEAEGWSGRARCGRRLGRRPRQ